MKLLATSGNERVDSVRDEFRSGVRSQLESAMAAYGVPEEPHFQGIDPTAGTQFNALDLAGGPKGDTTFGDTMRSLGSGTVGLVSGLTALAELAGVAPAGVGTGWLNEFNNKIVSSMTPSARADM